MKNPLLRLVDPGDGLRAAELALQATDRIEALEADRAAAIAGEDEDYVTKVATLDRELATQRANADAHRQRIIAMQERQRQAAQTRREQEMKSFIAEIEKRVKVRNAAGLRLDAAVKELVEAAGDLLATDEAVFATWPEVARSAGRLGFLRAVAIKPLSPRRTARTAPEPIRALLDGPPLGIADQLVKMGDELISELRSAPIAMPAEIDATGPRLADYGQSAAASLN